MTNLRTPIVQQPVLVLNLDQLRLLSSPALAEVFEAFTTHEIRSIPDIAAEVHRSQAAVGVHVQALLDAGLLQEVGTRKKRSRIERLFTRTAERLVTNFEGKPNEYHEIAVASFNASMRRAQRMHELYRLRVAQDITEVDFGQNLVRTMRLSREGSKKLIAAMQRFYAEVETIEEKFGGTDSDGERVRMTLMFHPTVASSEAKLKGKKR